EPQLLSLLRSEGENIGTVDLLGARRLLWLEEGGVAGGDIEKEDGARIGDPGEVEKVIVFAVMDGFGESFAGEQHEVPGLELLPELRAASGEFLRTAKIVHGCGVGVLSEGRGDAERNQNCEHESKRAGSQVHCVLQKTRKCTSREANFEAACD